MKFKKITLALLMSTPALLLAACGNDSKEKQAPNNLSYVDETGQEQTLVVEKTNDKLAINNALNALNYNSSREEIKTQYKSITGAKITSDLDLDFESVEKSDEGKVSIDLDGDGSVKGTIDFTNEQFDLSCNVSVDNSEKYSANGLSMKTTSKSSTNIQVRNNSKYVFLDGEANSKSTMFGQSHVEKQPIKNYIELSNPVSGEEIDLNEYFKYIYEDDSVSLDALYDSFYELNKLDEITISKTTEKKITFEFDSSKLFNGSETTDENSMFDFVESQLPFDFDFSLYMYVSIDTETFLISDFGFECSEKINLDDEEYGSTGSGKISIDFDFSIEYGQYSVDNSNIKVSDYEKFDMDFDDLDMGFDF